MKKNYLLITLFVLAGLCFSATAQNYPESSYELSQDGKTLVKWKGDETEIDFTQDEKLKELITIGENAFANNQKIKNIVLGDKVEVLEKMAFWCCYELQTIKLSAALRIVGRESLSCLKKLKEISFPPLVEIIGEGGMMFSPMLTKVTFEGNVLKEIGENAFSSCDLIEKYELPNSVEHIGMTAFYYNEKLKSINIPQNIKYFGDNPFSRCYLLESFEIPADNEHYMTEDGVIYTKDMSKLICYPYGKTDLSYTVPDDVESIGRAMFHFNYNLTEIIIPETVTEIKKQAFQGMSKMKSMVLPNSITHISLELFQGCDLVSLELGDKVKYIENSAIKGCKKLKKIICNTPNPPVLEDEWVLAYTENVTELVVPEGSQQRYKAPSFWRNFAREHSKKVKIVDPNGNEEAVPVDYPVASYKLSDDDKTLIKWLGTEKEIDLTRDSKLKELTAIGPGAFDVGQYELSEYEVIILGDKIETIGKTAFQLCTELKVVKIGDAVKIIDDSAFSNCTSLTDIVIPATVEKIGESAFIMCEAANAVVFEGGELKEIGVNAFRNCEDVKEFKLPRNVETIGMEAFYACAKLETVRLPRNLKSMGDSPFAMCEKLEKLDIHYSNKYYKTEDGVLYTQDGKKLIAYPSGKKDNVYNMPKGVEYIPTRAFVFNDHIEEMTIQEGLTEMGEEAFYTVNKLKKLVLPNSLTKLPYGAFKESEHTLALVELGDKVDFISNAAFSSCKALRTLISKNPEPPVLETEFVFNNVKDLKIFVPKGSKEKYENAPNWKEFIEGNENITVVEGGSTSVINAKAQKKFRLFVNASVLSIDNLVPGVNITIYTISGQQIFNKKASSVREEIVLNAGMYIVKVGDVAEKIIVR